MYKLILLDADNTIFDFEKAEGFALSETLKHFKIDIDFNIIRARYHEINSNMWSMLEKGEITKEELRFTRFEKLFKAFNIELSAQDFSTYYLIKLGEGNFLLDGAEELCKYLSSKYRVVILTNGIKDVQYSRIKSSVIYKYIEDIVTSDEVGINKPNKGIFEWTFNKINFNNKSEAIIIGDSLTSDIQGGINFGIDTCWFNFKKDSSSKKIDPTYSVESLKEIESIL